MDSNASSDHSFVVPSDVTQCSQLFAHRPRSGLGTFPLDVLLLILDAVGELKSEFDEPERGTLHACALTCHSMLRPSQVYLYADVKIVRERQFVAFGRALLSNPKLAPMVKKLYIDADGAWSNLTRIPACGLPLSPQAIGGMTNLQELTICGWQSFDVNKRRHSPLLEGLVESFALSCLNLQSVRLRMFEFEEFAGLLRLVSSFKCTTIDLDGVTWAKRGHVTNADIDHASGTTLRNLQVSGSSYSHW